MTDSLDRLYAAVLAERLLGIAEKLPKAAPESDSESRRQIVALDGRRLHKRR